MKISNRIPNEALATARGVLLPYVPELTTTMLVKAIENYNREDNAKKENKMPEQMTIMEVAKLLRVSRMTIFRYIRHGVLVANHITSRKVLIDAASVLKLLNAV